MSRQEKVAWWVLIVSAAVLGFLGLAIFRFDPGAAAPGTGLPPLMHNLSAMAMLILVTCQIVVQHSGQDLLEDERDLAIRRQAGRIGHSLLLSMLAVAAIGLGFGRHDWMPRLDAVAAGQWLLLVILSGVFVQAVTQVWLYRRDAAAIHHPIAPGGQA
jgi:hypothetical protein